MGPGHDMNNGGNVLFEHCQILSERVSLGSSFQAATVRGKNCKYLNKWLMSSNLRSKYLTQQKKAKNHGNEGKD